MARVIEEGVPDFVPIVLTMEQAEATCQALSVAFMATLDKRYAQAMVRLVDAVDQKLEALQLEQEASDV